MRKTYFHKALFISCILAAAIFLLSSCSASRRSSVAFEERKYTKGHFFDRIPKIPQVNSAKTGTKQKTKTAIAKSPTIKPVHVVKSHESDTGLPVLRQSNALVQAITKSGFVSKLVSPVIQKQNSGGNIPAHNFGQDNNPTSYGLTGLLLTIFSLIGMFGSLVFLFATAIIATGGGISNNAATNNITVGILILVTSVIAFIVGFVFNILGTNKSDRHRGAAIAGLVLDILFILLLVSLFI